MKNHGLILNISQHPFLARSLGAHRIAHYLRERNWNIEVVDWANWWQVDQLKEFFKSRYTSSTKFVAFSHLFSIWFDHMEEFAHWIKSNYPDVVLFSGSSVNPMFKSTCIDWYIQGFGEHAVVELLKYIVGNGNRPKFQLLGEKKVIAANQYYPSYPMKSLMVKYENRDFINSKEWLTIETSRGCKFQCSFCQFPILGVKEDTSRDADDFSLQLKDAYDRFGVTMYMLADETFNDRSEKISKFADAVESLDFDPWFSSYIRPDLLASRPRDREELLRMNVVGHFYGIESLNHRSAQSIGKGMDPDKIKQTLLEVKNYFLSNGQKLYRGHVSLIAGLPYETERTLMNSLDWLIQNWQGQSFGIHALGLPAKNSMAKASKISENLYKFGYEEMSPEELPSSIIESNSRSIQKKGNFKEIDNQVLWKNQNMNIFDAERIVDRMYEIKLKHDFRPGNFMINYRLKKSFTMTELLSLTFEEYDSLLNHSLDDYINKKLSLTGP